MTQQLRTLIRVAVGLAILLPGGMASSAARAGIVSVSGNGDILIPGVDATGATADFFNDPGPSPLVHGWNEKQNVVLDRDVYVDIINSGTYSSRGDLGGFNEFKIAAGTRVSSHLLYFDPERSQTVSDVTYTFDGKILGVIVDSDRFWSRRFGFTDYFLQSDFLGNPLTVYPTNHYRFRGLEWETLHQISVDVYGRTLTIDFLSAGSPGDQIRVLTAAIPEPSSVVSLGIAACLGLGLAVRRRLLRSPVRANG
jgi:hypothetical protein